MAWDDDSRAKAVELYQEKEPTPENTLEIIKEIAEEMGQTPNGVRTILSKAGVYVKATPAGQTKGGDSAGPKTPRVSKADQQEKLADLIRDFGAEPDMEIISRMSGKACDYFTNTFKPQVDD